MGLDVAVRRGGMPISCVCAARRASWEPFTRSSLFSEPYFTMVFCDVREMVGIQNVLYVLKPSAGVPHGKQGRMVCHTASMRLHPLPLKLLTHIQYTQNL